MEPVFDARGYPVAWLDEAAGVLRNRGGAVIAWMDQDAAFANSGRMVCWHQDGIFYIRDGVVACLANTQSGPLKPHLRRHGRPPVARAIGAARAFRQLAPPPPIPDRWSSVTWQDALEGTY